MQIETGRGEHGWIDAMSLDACLLLSRDGPETTRWVPRVLAQHSRNQG
jgi:hypothetical protein